jgi:hypothetical protein
VFVLMMRQEGRDKWALLSRPYRWLAKRITVLKVTSLVAIADGNGQPKAHHGRDEKHESCCRQRLPGRDGGKHRRDGQTHGFRQQEHGVA